MQNSKSNLTSRHFAVVLRKKEKKAEYWPRLTKEKVKNAYLKTDFSKWVDEDEQDGEPVKDDDFGGMPGMGGMPPGMEGLGGMGGMGGGINPGMGNMGGGMGNMGGGMGNMGLGPGGGGMGMGMDMSPRGMRGMLDDSFIH